ncbi:hypothetical protein A583_01272 [Corynebacterium glutamicum Z188]|uniref:biotin-independent malonate decarboxylase subunit beta n=1 Tax=Corynebacterium glutamicum TaxID=1718 RepID=UPI00022328B9|nr:biotin-independent malonate decarboxylase subunit beta [Corynebacterium glutamicum]AGN17935.1 hypothetical protein C624_01730 [Corynebacterium glutamicum SCgG1]AGN20958.1 hypothetical protein C629_01730 [Corynebacterium glutamicum SCgG2]EGV40864.1 hypothetical protein CgS9114_05877 [Corynebacterium glutamicum S9114]EPP41923.1 hypothetical protein A583_01272 [Corynebacterium glutamicum Z188]NII88600.1 malonate decarboxylase beta subunit [Corynebacterium glutamicum]
MQIINETFPATIPFQHDIHVGVVGSGDMEILISAPRNAGKTTVKVATSVDGFDTVWRNVLKRFFGRNPLEADITINDFGATPGMAMLRLTQAFEQATSPQTIEISDSSPFTELSARQRVQSLLDPGTFRELLDPFQEIQSPHLEPQGIVPQLDDGAVLGRGTINGDSAIVVGLEGKFQGGGIGEVSGAKIAAALERALVDAKAGHNIRVVLLLETGGIRLQEANLGLLAIAEIHSAIVELQRYTPVVCVVAGMVGCFGGMGIAAGLCDHIIMTREGRLALNGPEVIETEAGVQELNASDRPAIWKMIGGEQRVATGRADVLSDDTVESIRAAVVAAPVMAYTYHRANNLDSFNAQLENLNPSARPTAEELRTFSV